nr:unnamed protein product [Digitaria exilis]
MMNLVIVWLLLVSSSSSCSGTPSDIQCLRGLKESLSDPNHALSSWKLSENTTDGYICEFAGVDCWRPSESKVLSLHLGNMGLRGPFPRALQFCTSMTALDLSGNNISGPVPADINLQLSYTTSLDLSNNSFSGEIPSGIGNMTYLSALNLEHNRFTGRIPELNLPRLTSFSVADNSLSGPIPASLGRFPAEDFAGNAGLCGSPPLDRKCKKHFHARIRAPQASAGFVAGFVVAFYFPHWFVFCGGLRPYIFRVCG